MAAQEVSYSSLNATRFGDRLRDIWVPRQFLAASWSCHDCKRLAASTTEDTPITDCYHRSISGVKAKRLMLVPMMRTRIPSPFSKSRSDQVKSETKERS
jgi:hypothetical protein